MVAVIVIMLLGAMICMSMIIDIVEKTYDTRWLFDFFFFFLAAVVIFFFVMITNNIIVVCGTILCFKKQRNMCFFLDTSNYHWSCYYLWSDDRKYI